MTQLNPVQLVGAAALFLPALVWAIVATDLWSFVLRVRPRNEMSRLMPWLTTLVAAFFFVATIFTLLPQELHERPPPLLIALYILQDTIIILAMALTRHLSMVMAPEAPTPSRRWLIAHYGVAALIIVVCVNPHVLPGATWDAKLYAMRIIHFTYIIVMLVLSVARAARFARRGLWRPGSLGDLRTADIVVLTAGVLGVAVLFVVLLRPERARLDDAVVAAAPERRVGLALATPFAVRALGAGRPRAGRHGRSTSSSSAASIGRRAPVAAGRAARISSRCCSSPRCSRRSAADPAQAPSARGRRPPGVPPPSPPPVASCRRRSCGCRRSSASSNAAGAPWKSFVRIMHLRGAGVLLDDGTVVAVGSIDMEPLRRVWPRGTRRAARCRPRCSAAGSSASCRWTSRRR